MCCWRHWINWRFMGSCPSHCEFYKRSLVWHAAHRAEECKSRQSLGCPVIMQIRMDPSEDSIIANFPHPVTDWIFGLTRVFYKDHHPTSNFIWDLHVNKHVWRSCCLDDLTWRGIHWHHCQNLVSSKLALKIVAHSAEPPITWIHDITVTPVITRRM